MDIKKSLESDTKMSSSSAAIESDQRRIICQDTFDEVIDFYNTHEHSFKSFESIFGFNVWFINHFRTYMNYRNLKLEKGGINDPQSNGERNKLNPFQIVFRVAKEFIFMLFSYRRIKSDNSDYVVISNSSDVLNGQNKRFGSLDFKQLYNRVLLDVKQKVSLNDFAPSHMMSTDRIFMDYLFKFTFISDFLKVKRHLKQLQKKISESLDSKNSNRYVINKIFWANRPFYIISYLRFRSLDLFFQKSELKAILVSDENSPQQMIIQYAARKHDIKIFGFQHGNIHLLHPAYIYGNYKSKPLLPTITFTWGSYFTELLISAGGYTKDQVITVGRILPDNNLRKLNPLLENMDNILLYASQPQRDAKIRSKLLADVLWSAKNMGIKYQLVIRPHPRETEDSFFKKIADEVGFHNFIIDRESDLASHMEACKVLIIAFSTVGTEFISYYKPMLVLDYLNQDLINWIKEGVGIPIRSKEGLLDALRKDELKINEQAYKLFLNKYYITGNKVIEQVKEAIYESS